MSCSTPFGIIGILTLASLVREIYYMRAQRLSASSEFSLGRGRRKPTLCRCAQRLSASSEFSQRWFQLYCLSHFASLFSRISSFRFLISFSQPWLSSFLCHNPLRIRHLRTTQVCPQPSYPTYLCSLLSFPHGFQAFGSQQP